MVGFGKLIRYHASALEELAENPDKVSPEILADTIRHCITEIRDTIHRIEGKVSDTKTIRGELKDGYRDARKTRRLLNFFQIQENSVKQTDDHFTDMEKDFKELDGYTNILGDAAKAMANYLAGKLAGNLESGLIRAEVNCLLSFDPKAEYKEGKLVLTDGSKTLNGQDSVPAGEYEKKLNESLSAGRNEALHALMALKLSGAVLRASIDYDSLRLIKDVNDYPSYSHRAIANALMGVETALGYLMTMDIPQGLERTLDACERKRISRLSQWYVNHKFKKSTSVILGVLGITSGAAAIYIGIPQVQMWWQTGVIDLTTTPGQINQAKDWLPLALTSYALSALIFTGLTVLSDLGKNVVNYMRDIKPSYVKTVGIDRKEMTAPEFN